MSKFKPIMFHDIFGNPEWAVYSLIDEAGKSLNVNLSGIYLEWIKLWGVIND